ncbi:RICIN domain-containing protein [Streptomyces fuscichromogenes]|uniref:RICIN domain-containing protein n=1 Tax=Streptomyces fuscichromogenes TaxID=1324013 RepID=UPI00380D0645
MKQISKRTLRVALTTFVATATMGVFATSASAGDNTWIRQRDFGICIASGANGYVHGSSFCNNNDSSQLWDRVGSTIKRAYTNQCLDSNDNGDVYYLECNGGDYQNWNYLSINSYGDALVQDRATGKYLYVNTGTNNIATSDNGYWWSFYGGQ